MTRAIETKIIDDWFQYHLAVTTGFWRGKTLAKPNLLRSALAWRDQFIALTEEIVDLAVRNGIDENSLKLIVANPQDVSAQTLDDAYARVCQLWDIADRGEIAPD